MHKNYHHGQGVHTPYPWGAHPRLPVVLHYLARHKNPQAARQNNPLLLPLRGNYTGFSAESNVRQDYWLRKPQQIGEFFVLSDKLSSINPQQQDYFWGTAELIKWKAYNGKETNGIVYKPENFDPKKKYPLICYFYETLSNGLYTYLPPSPTPSRLSIFLIIRTSIRSLLRCV